MMRFEEAIDDAVPYWELRRLYYNLTLAAVVLGWIWMTWPAFFANPLLSFVPAFFVLAVMANIFYCAAYLADLPMQYSSFAGLWRRLRWMLWAAGTLFASLLTSIVMLTVIYDVPLD